MAALAWVSRSAVNLRFCWEARFGFPACTAKGVHSLCTFPLHFAGPDGAKPALKSPGTNIGAHVITVLPEAREEQVEDDRGNIEPGERVLLIIEDDPHYARILLDMAR